MGFDWPRFKLDIPVATLPKDEVDGDMGLVELEAQGLGAAAAAADVDQLTVVAGFCVIGGVGFTVLPIVGCKG